MTRGKKEEEKGREERTLKSQLCATPKDLKGTIMCNPSASTSLGQEAQERALLVVPSFVVG